MVAKDNDPSLLGPGNFSGDLEVGSLKPSGFSGEQWSVQPGWFKPLWGSLITNQYNGI